MGHVACAGGTRLARLHSAHVQRQVVRLRVSAVAVADWVLGVTDTRATAYAEWEPEPPHSRPEFPFAERSEGLVQTRQNRPYTVLALRPPHDGSTTGCWCHRHCGHHWHDWRRRTHLHLLPCRFPLLCSVCESCCSLRFSLSESPLL